MRSENTFTKEAQKGTKNHLFFDSIWIQMEGQDQQIFNPITQKIKLIFIMWSLVYYFD